MPLYEITRRLPNGNDHWVRVECGDFHHAVETALAYVADTRGLNGPARLVRIEQLPEPNTIQPKKPV